MVSVLPFNLQWYLSQNPDVADAASRGVVDAFEHYETFGKVEGRSANPLFDPTYYLNSNPDVANAVARGDTSAYDHFLAFGAREGRSPLQLFGEAFYLLQNPDVAQAVEAGAMTAVEHFLLFGQNESRPINASIDLGDYLNANPDVAKAVADGFMSAMAHLMMFGVQEFRDLGNGVNLRDFAKDPAFNQALTSGNIETALARVGDVAPFLPTFVKPANWIIPATTPLPIGFVPVEGKYLVVPEGFELPEGTELPEGFEPKAPPDDPPDNPPVTPEIFILTTGVDTIMGTIGNDGIRGVVDSDVAANNTLSTADSIDGGAGNDTFNILFDVAAATAMPAATIKNVENFELRNVSGHALTVDFATISGEEQVWNTASTSDVTVNNLASGTVLGVQGNAGLAVSATNATYVAGATAASILISGGVGTTAAASGAISATGADLTLAIITSQGGANFVGGVTLANTVKTVNIDVQTNLTTTAFGGVAAGAVLNVSGAGKASLGTLDASVDVIDASKNTGGVTLMLDGETDTKFTGGAGADVVTLGASALTTGTVDGGAGNDTLVANSTNLNSAATGAKYINFEVLRSTSGGTINLDNIAGITAIELDGGSVTGLSAAQAGSVKVLSSPPDFGTYEIGVRGASTAGQIDTVALTIDDGLVTKDTIYLNLPTLTGVENLNINAVDNVNVWSLANAISLNSITLSGAGDQSITADAVNLSDNTVIDGSAATGKLIIDASSAQAGIATVGFSITGGSAIDTINGTLKGDIINGDAGSDTLFGRGGADTIVGGEGNDVIVGDGTYSVAATERASVRFSDLAVDDTLTLAGLTLNNTSGSIITPQNLAYFFGSGGSRLPGGASSSGALTGYTTEHPGYGIVVFASTTENSNVADLTQTGTGSVISISITQGVSASTPTLGGDTAGADILTGGAGNDQFLFAAGSSHATITDTITDLNLGSDVLAGQVDTLVFQNAGAIATVVNLTTGEQGAITSTASLAAAAAAVANVASTGGNTVQFTYDTDIFIYHNVDGNGTFDDSADLLVKVTGVVGTLDASDIVLL